MTQECVAAVLFLSFAPASDDDLKSTAISRHLLSACRTGKENDGTCDRRAINPVLVPCRYWCPVDCCGLLSPSRRLGSCAIILQGNGILSTEDILTRHPLQSHRIALVAFRMPAGSTPAAVAVVALPPGVRLPEDDAGPGG